MTSQGSPYSRLQRALAAKQLWKALDAASELNVVALDDAFELCILLAAEGDRRFEAAASRWLERFAAERHPPLQTLMLAGAALAELGRSPSSGAARETLEQLLAGPSHQSGS